MNSLINVALWLKQKNVWEWSGKSKTEIIKPSILNGLYDK